MRVRVRVRVRACVCVRVRVRVLGWIVLAQASGAAAMYGMAASVPDRTVIGEIVHAYIDSQMLVSHDIFLSLIAASYLHSS